MAGELDSKTSQDSAPSAGAAGEQGSKWRVRIRRRPASMLRFGVATDDLRSWAMVRDKVAKTILSCKTREQVDNTGQWLIDLERAGTIGGEEFASYASVLSAKRDQLKGDA
jgi:hypothetical protein